MGRIKSKQRVEDRCFVHKNAISYSHVAMSADGSAIRETVLTRSHLMVAPSHVIKYVNPVGTDATNDVI